MSAKPLRVGLSRQDGSFGYAVEDEGAVVAFFDLRALGYDVAEAEARKLAFEHNRAHHSRVGSVVPAYGNRDWDLKHHYVVGDEADDHVRVACGKLVRNSRGGTVHDLGDARAIGFLETSGYGVRFCKKCRRSPDLARALAELDAADETLHG